MRLMPLKKRFIAFVIWIKKEQMVRSSVFLESQEFVVWKLPSECTKQDWFNGEVMSHPVCTRWSCASSILWQIPVFQNFCRNLSRRPGRPWWGRGCIWDCSGTLTWRSVKEQHDAETKIDTPPPLLSPTTLSLSIALSLSPTTLSCSLWC